MHLRELMLNAGISHVHVVDDAFDRCPGAELRPESIQTFLGKMDDGLYDEISSLLGIPEGTEDQIISSLSTLEGANILYWNRSRFGNPAEELFESFSAGLESERSRIDLLVDFLKDIGIEYHTFGRDYCPDGQPEPQILFVDLKLNEREVCLNQPINVVKKLRSTYPTAHPLVFLMSSLQTSLLANREQFRDDCELLTTQFEILHKRDFHNPKDLELFLSHHINVYPHLCKLQSHILSWGNALDVAKQKLQQTLRSLDLPDYFILYSNTVAVEQVPLGTYVTDLLLEYVAHEIEASSGVSVFAEDLDAWKLGKITRLRFNLAPVVGDVFSANVLHAFPRIEAETNRGRGPRDGYLNLGDVFFLTNEIERKAIRTAYVVLSPACDLVRPDVMAKRKASVFLCEGDVELLKPTFTLKEIDGLYPVILRYPYVNGQQYTITWQKKRPNIWRPEDLDELKGVGRKTYTHVGRLRPSYALQLQHLVTSDLSRIGVQRPPDVYTPYGVEVLVADDGKWKLLLNSFRDNPSAGAISHNKGTRRHTFMLSDVLVRAALREIREWIEKYPQKDRVQQLKDVLECPEVDRALISYVNEDKERVEDEEQTNPGLRKKYKSIVAKHYSRRRASILGATIKSSIPITSFKHSKRNDVKESPVPIGDEIIRPLVGRLAGSLPNHIAESVIFAQQGRRCDDQFNGGKKIASLGLLVFKFMKI